MLIIEANLNIELTLLIIKYIMIKYKLICKDCETTFDSWFSSSKEYEKLKRKNFKLSFL